MKTLIQLTVASSIALLLGAAPATQPTADCCTPAGATMAAAKEAPVVPAGKADAATLFEKMKSLVGTWDAEGGPMKCTYEYSLTGGGSTVVENQDMHGGMMTMYSLDGDRVIVTHYCGAGNQPRMTSEGLIDGKSAKFSFLDATGMKSPDDGHMHELALTFAPDGTVTQNWTMYSDSKPAGVVTIKLKRAV